jgi:hypothetical protein
LPRLLQANVKSKTTLESDICSVPLVLTFVNEFAAAAHECQTRDTNVARKCPTNPKNPALDDPA